MACVESERLLSSLTGSRVLILDSITAAARTGTIKLCLSLLKSLNSAKTISLAASQASEDRKNPN